MDLMRAFGGEDPQLQEESIEETGTEPVSSRKERKAAKKRARKERRRRERGPFWKGAATGIVFCLCVEVFTSAMYASANAVIDSSTRSKIETILDLLEANYYDYDSVTTQQLQDGLISGLVDAVGDKYTTYYTAEEQENYTVTTEGSYSGIGSGVTEDTDGWPMVSHVYEGTPAEEAGLVVGDRIMQVDDYEVTSDSSTTEVASWIRGEEGTSVHIVLDRDGETVEVDIVRADIETPSVESQMLDDRIGYLYITSFAENTTEQFASAYEALEEEGMEALVLDLRYNGGGTVSSCVEIMDYILPEGVTLTMEDASGETEVYTSDAENYIDLPMVVLVNGSTASASEILTAALKDYDYATIIGTTTFGKGIYQSAWTLTDGSGIKMTAGKFYSPDGYNYHGVGIEPDIELEYENTAGEDASYSELTDNQILKAMEVLEEELDGE